MRRHELDWASLLGGLVALAIAATYLVTRFTAVAVDPRWLVPGVLLGLGAAGLAATVSRIGRDDGAAARGEDLREHDDW